MKIGARIKKIRFQLALTLKEFGLLIDNRVSKGTVSNWENGVNIPRYERIKKIALLGGVSINMILYGQEQVPIFEEVMIDVMGVDLCDFLEINHSLNYKGKRLTNTQRNQLMTLLNDFAK